jgi:hypothetical protein
MSRECLDGLTASTPCVYDSLQQSSRMTRLARRLRFELETKQRGTSKVVYAACADGLMHRMNRMNEMYASERHSSVWTLVSSC